MNFYTHSTCYKLNSLSSDGKQWSFVRFIFIKEKINDVYR